MTMYLYMVLLGHMTDSVVLFQCGSSPFKLNPFQINLEFGTTHQVQMCYTSKQV